MSKVKFITSEYLKENTPIDGNVSNTLLDPFIFKSQDIHIQTALGTLLYEAIKAKIVSGAILTELDYKTLLDDFINPTLAEWTLYESMPFIGFKLTNKAVTQKNSDSSTPSGVDDIKWLRNSVRDSAEFYTKRLNEYLCTYESLFSELTENRETNEKKASGKTGFFGGIYIPRS